MIDYYYTHIEPNNQEWSLNQVMTTRLDGDIVENEFDLLLSPYVHIRSNTPRKSIIILNPPDDV